MSFKSVKPFFWFGVQLISIGLMTRVGYAEVAPDSNNSESFFELTTNNANEEKQEISQTPNSQLLTPKTSLPTPLTIFDPAPNTLMDVPATTVKLQFAQGALLELRVNGLLVDSKQVGRVETNVKNKSVTQVWYGVALQQGENTITAQTIVDGVVSETAEVKVQVRGSLKQISLRTLETRIPANSRSTATVEGELLDASGNRSNQDAFVTLKATAGEFVGQDASSEQPGFQVKAQQGVFRASLRSTLQAQTIRIQAKVGDVDAFTQLVTETDLRSSLVTGVIDVRLGKRGTDFYKSFRDFIPPDQNNQTQLDFNSAVFATGNVGGWLFTGAFNSARPLNQTCENTTRLFRDIQFCEQNYPVYGDSSTSEVLTPSLDSFYAKFERTAPGGLGGVDSFMWGDFNTWEFATRSQEFTATTRQLHGFKANYHFGNLQATAIYANNLQGFQRDTIAPDGTSGFYFLSRRLLVPGSENVFIELEELNRPGTVLARTQLNRNADYEIDYNRGTLLFRQPLLRTDVDQLGQVLVRRIVISYEYENQDNSSNLYAGRLRYHFNRTANQESWLGATYLYQNQGIRDFELYGADALISFGSSTNIIAEYANSRHNSDVIGEVSGAAYRLEANTEITRGLQARAYYRKADTGFANNATISFVPGQTRYGAQIFGALSQSTKFRLQYDHEDNEGTAPRLLNTLEDLLRPRTEALPGARVDNSLTTISAGVQQQFGKATIDLDLLHRNRTDRIISQSSGKSEQLRSRLTFPITEKLTFLAQNELTLSDNTDAVYPDRTVLGLNWSLVPGINLRLGQQFYSRGQFAGQSITSLDLDGEYKLGSDTSLTGRYGILGGANGMTVQGAIGLNQRWQISPKLKLDLAYEHIFGDFSGITGAGKQFIQPLAPGQSASSLGLQGGDSYNFGLEYNDGKNFQASVRYQHRSSSGGNNTVISAGATGKISPALTALVRYQQAGSSNVKTQTASLQGIADTANLKVGLAYRDPNNDKFNALLRYEYRQNPSTIPDTILLGSGIGVTDHTFAAEAIYAPNWQWEFYGKYALRNSTSYLANDLVGTSTINLGQLRATYRLGYSADLVGEVRLINQGNYTETGFVVETGYYLSPNLRLAGGYVFGRVDDRDFSGSTSNTRSVGGPYIGLTLKLNELFDGFGLQKPLPKPPESKQQDSASVPNNISAAGGAKP
ncbi:MAG: TonB-dependent receptor [Calothrix sp. C42_A2020_038]|nr:TonB-dependent receptor [Calothrix sp. C42_A2020_038]